MLEIPKAIAKRIVYGWSSEAYQGDHEKDVKDNENVTKVYSFMNNDEVVQALKQDVFQDDLLSKLSDDALNKIIRQIEFWYAEGGLNKEELVTLGKKLVRQSTWYNSSHMDSIPFKVPKVRFGKTEIQMPIITCGGMRFQNTWAPDNIPLLAPPRDYVLNSKVQQNVINCVRTCLKMGINHFETARMYGTSEYQLVEALYEMIQSGEIKREDFIFQTKLLPSDSKGFVKSWNASWNNVEKLQYVDLCSVHGAMHLDDNLFTSIDILEQFKKEGKIKHIGFSTHGCAKQILALINTEKFEYVNLHHHFFGDYHAQGTPNPNGGHGNTCCVQRALELDMGVFNISPFDKGGKLYRPSQDVALTIGKDLTPMAFAALTAWKKFGMHTISVGIARPSDLDEVLEAARIFSEADDKSEIQIVNEAESRLIKCFEAKLGKEWFEKGYDTLPSMYDEPSDGMAIGHMLWLHNLLTAFGMYEFCKDRYLGLEATSWSKKKSFMENAKAMSAGNPGRSFDALVDLSKALEKHYNPELVIQKLNEVHAWLNKDVKFSDEELIVKGWKKGYNLTVWEEHPGELDSTAIKKVLLQLFTGGRLGVLSGSGEAYKKSSSDLRSSLQYPSYF